MIHLQGDFERHTAMPPAPQRGAIGDYVHVARPDHWIKNIFLVPGFLAALAVVPGATVAPGTAAAFVVAVASLCLTASANYTINEYLDAPFDRHHPLKRERPGARGVLDPRLILLQYLVLSVAGLLLASRIGTAYLLTDAWLLLMGVIYNVAPLRSKDRAYLDVLSESINNPIRFLLGWFIIAPTLFPPASALLAYWMGGAFLMAVKRYAEYRRIADPATAALYRRSFGVYTESRLLLSSFFYANASAFFIAIFLIKYRAELILTFPLFAALFTWYLAIGLDRDSVAQAPEKLYRQVAFLAFSAFTLLVAALMFVIDIPFLSAFSSAHLLRLP